MMHSLGFYTLFAVAAAKLAFGAGKLKFYIPLRLAGQGPTENARYFFIIYVFLSTRPGGSRHCQAGVYQCAYCPCTSI